MKNRELTLRSVLLGIGLTLLLAMSNAYLALKLGILTSASIPAAIISMGILRFFKNPTILENNAVQTAASAGEAVAGGIVYTIPALIIIGFWHHFDYFTNFFIAASGGVLGVLFSIPLRRILVQEPLLKFPEGKAIAEVLKTSSQKIGLRDIVLGGALGALLEFLQTGLKLLANQWNYWFTIKRSIFGVGAGFSATMLGAGYLVGFDMAVSMFIGALVAWAIALPIMSQFYPEFLQQYPLNEAAVQLWNGEMRYLGIGAMLFAGIWTFIKLAKPLLNSMSVSFRDFKSRKSNHSLPIQRDPTDKDIPLPFILGGTLLIAILLYVFFGNLFPLQAIGLNGILSPVMILFTVLYVLVVGFLFSVITAYFSGMVGVTASPGSSVVIAGILFAAWLLLTMIHVVLPLPLNPEQLKAAEAITIVIGSVVTGIAAIANDNSQDLKVGYLVGATPWKQQLMLLLGVLVSALIIPPVMQLLFEVYGIAGVLPHPGMNPANSLPAPTAALLAAVTEGVFRDSLPWTAMFAGASIILTLVLCIRFFRLDRFLRLSPLGVAIGMYLPLSSTFPLFIGGVIAFIAERRLQKRRLTDTGKSERRQTGTLIACGLVAGSALMDVVLAIPFSLLRSPDALSVVTNEWERYGTIGSVLLTFLLGTWIIRRVSSR